MAKASRARRGLPRWLADTATPLFVVDARRVVLFFNHGCESVTGWAAADVIGRTCEYGCETDRARAESVTDMLCPPAEVFDGQCACVPVEVPHRDGASTQMTVHFFPMPAGDPPIVDHVLGALTHRRGAECGPVSSIAAAHAALARARQELRQRYRIDAIVATGPAMRRVLAQTRFAAETTASVHLSGEAGVGKLHIARTIHGASPSAEQDFVPIDCRTLPAFETKRTIRQFQEALVERASDRPPATLFLRDVDALQRDAQELVLDGLRSGMRLMSAATRPLADGVASEDVLPEFLFAATEVVIDVPPLRERREDLLLLAQHLLEECNRGQLQQVEGFSPDVAELLLGYGWPGNVAELAAVVREAHATATTSIITTEQLPFRFVTGLDAQATRPAQALEPIDLETELAKIEAEYIREALTAAKGNRAQAARLLNLTRPKLYRRMEQLGMAEGE